MLSFEMNKLSEVVDHDVYWNSIKMISSRQLNDVLHHPLFMSLLEHGVQIGAIRDDVPLNVLIRMNTEYEVWLLQEIQEERLNEQQVVDKFFEMFKQLFEIRR